MLNIPTDARTAAFEAVRKRLRHDPILSRADVVRGWKFMPYGDFTKHITGDKLPYVVTGLKAGSTGVASPNAALHTMEIWIEHVVSAMGVDEEDAWKDCINLCGQIEKAINGLGKDLAWIRDAIQAVDPTAVLMGDLVFKTAGYTPRAFDNGFQACVGQSVLTIPLKLDTCRKAEEYAPVA